MTDRLVIGVLGKPDSGKSYTWNKLFGRNDVRTGKNLKKLELRAGECVNVFLVSGSPEERKKYVGELIGESKPSIVLCSMQYSSDVRTTIDFFLDAQYWMYVHWLNPGHGESQPYADTEGLMDYLLHCGVTVSARRSDQDLSWRIDEIKNFIYGWASARGLVEFC